MVDRAPARVDPVCIVVTGAPRAGKTTLCRLLGQLTGFEIVNVGDLLQDALLKVGVRCEERRRLGRMFLARFGEEEYTRAVRHAAVPNRILDGVRLASGVQAARAAAPTVHLHKLAPWRNGVPDDFEGELASLERDADAVVPWLPSEAALEERVRALLSASLPVSGGRPPVRPPS